MVIIKAREWVISNHEELVNNLLVSKKKKICTKRQIVWFLKKIMVTINKKQKMIDKQIYRHKLLKKKFNPKNSP